jgi:general secretion pathway protein A
MNFEFFYGMSFNPFEKSIDSRHLFHSNDFKEFSSRMEYFKSSKGFACVFGEPGSGKTSSLRALTASLNPQLFKVVYLPLSSVAVQDFYRHLAIGLDLGPGFVRWICFIRSRNRLLNPFYRKI